MDPAEKVTFHLRYEELLQRSDQGKYHYSINIQPQNQKIPDFKIKVNINESLPLDDISVSRQSYRYQELHTQKVWQYGLWSFQVGGTKLERFLQK